MGWQNAKRLGEHMSNNDQRAEAIIQIFNDKYLCPRGRYVKLADLVTVNEIIEQRGAKAPATELLSELETEHARNFETEG
jgi:hypothetical protein